MPYEPIISKLKLIMHSCIASVDYVKIEVKQSISPNKQMQQFDGKEYKTWHGERWSTGNCA